MKKNMGSLDRILRLVVVAVIGALYFSGVISGALGITLLVASIVFLLTSLTGWCPIYAITGIKTCAVKQK